MRKLLIPGILILSFLLGAASLTRGHGWGDDFASYIMQSESILNGEIHEFVQRNVFTMSESSAPVGPLAYPWGYPLALAPVYALKGNSPLALKLPALLFFGGFLICLYLWMKNHLTPTESLLIYSLFAFNPLLIDFLDQILSDIPFLFFSTLALLFMTDSNKRSTVDRALLGSAIAFAFFIRATGILLLASFLAVETFRLWRNRLDYATRRKTFLDISIVCLTFGLLWGIYALLFPGGGESYLAQFAGLNLEVVISFIVAYFNVFSLFFGATEGWRYLYYILFVFFLLGVWERRKDKAILIIFSALWMAVHITYPFWQGPRYIFPLLPIFIYFTFQGMTAAIDKLPETYFQAGRAAFHGFWLFLIGTFLLTSTIRAYTNMRNGREINGPFDPVSREVYAYIKEETPPDSVVVFFKPRAMRLMTDRDALMIEACEGMLKGDYLVLSKKVGENNQIPPERIDSCNLPLEKVFDNRRFIVYEVRK